MGILERIYDVDRGTTQILVERGFLANYIERSNVIPNPEQLIEVLRDHRAAVELVHDCVANSRPLTKGFIHDLHSTKTILEALSIAPDAKSSAAIVEDVAEAIALKLKRRRGEEKTSSRNSDG